MKFGFLQFVTKKKIKTEKIDENDNMWLICKIRVTFMCIVICRNNVMALLS